MATQSKRKKEPKDSKASATKESDRARYFEAVGRRKTSVSRVRLTPSSKGLFVVNDRPIEKYFTTQELQKIANDAFVGARAEASYGVSAHIHGGGIHSQAEALRHSIARALVVASADNRTTLKRLGYLTRDARAKERRKFGLKKARKAPQWAKR